MVKMIVEKLVQRFRRTHTLEDVKKIRDEINAKQEKSGQLTKAEKISAKAVKIFILAGGVGSRLQSVVSDVPKPMADINGDPFLDYLIRHIRLYFDDTI